MAETASTLSGKTTAGSNGKVTACTSGLATPASKLEVRPAALRAAIAGYSLPDGHTPMRLPFKSAILLMPDFFSMTSVKPDFWKICAM